MAWQIESWKIERIKIYKRDGYVWRYKFVYSKGNRKARCELDLFVKLIMGDYHVRELAQQEETLKEKGRALRKMRNADEDEAQLQKLEEEQEALRKKCWYQEWELYNWQCSIPSGPIKLAYESLRKNPKWYMQKELIKDCAARGGCCGRGCGCFEKRESTPGRDMGAGHCTTGCACCLSFRGYELTATERDDIRDALKANLEDRNMRNYLLTLSRAYLIRDKEVEKKVEDVDSAPKRSKWREIIGRK